MPSYDITTYTGLANAIQAFTEVDETSFVANIPTFVQDTERLVNNTVQLPAFRKNVTGSATANFPYLTLPSDFLATFSVAVMDIDAPLTPNNYRYLLNKDVNYIREAFPYPGVTGTPQYYALFDNNTYILGPTPEVNYNIELHYFAYPESIVTAGTTWLSQNFPNVLLYGALTEAYLFLKGEADVLQAYQAKFQEAMVPLKQLGDGKDRQDEYRTVQVRDKVV
jgi:hypothetical protein